MLSPQSKSWYLNEATDMHIELSDVYVKPYTTMMSMVLKSQVFRGTYLYFCHFIVKLLFDWNKL